MIARIKGILSEFIDDHLVMIEVAGIGYEILLPAIVMKELRGKFAPGDEVILSTLYEIETSGGFGHMNPRLIGFLTDREKRFFERLVKVRDFGAKRAMKSLVVSFEQVATAIEQGDTKFLATLPEIGKRSAEKIVAELKGKMAEFLPDGQVIETEYSMDTMPDFKREAMLALTQLGYRELEARRLINSALQRNPDLDKSDELLREVFSKPD